jgi:hypothetical protein
MAEVVRERRGLDDVRRASAERVELGTHHRVAGQPLGDGPGHLRHLQAVGEPVVQQQTGAGRAHDLGDAGQPCEERRGRDAVPVHAERAGGQPRAGLPRRSPRRPGGLIKHGGRLAASGTTSLCGNPTCS